MTEQEYNRLKAKTTEYEELNQTLFAVKDMKNFVTKTDVRDLSIRLQRHSDGYHRVIDGGPTYAERLRVRVVDAILEELTYYEEQLVHAIGTL